MKENVCLARMALRPGPFLDLAEEEGTVSEIVRRLRVATPSIRQEVIKLSGGNQQKVVLAKWLLADADVFLFDEPTRGIDIGAKEEIYRLMTDLSRAGKVVIMVSSDIPELTAMSDRVGVMRNGRLVIVLGKGRIDEEQILAYSIGAATG